jgi:hypothetical protein
MHGEIFDKYSGAVKLEADIVEGLNEDFDDNEV